MASENGRSKTEWRPLGVVNCIKELRTERQLSQKALAEQLQLAGYEFSDLTVLRIEQGTRFVPDYEVVALAEYFQVSCEYLLGVKNEK